MAECPFSDALHALVPHQREDSFCLQNCFPGSREGRPIIILISPQPLLFRSAIANFENKDGASARADVMWRAARDNRANEACHSPCLGIQLPRRDGVLPCQKNSIHVDCIEKLLQMRQACRPWWWKGATSISCSKLMRHLGLKGILLSQQLAHVALRGGVQHVEILQLRVKYARFITIRTCKVESATTCVAQKCEVRRANICAGGHSREGNSRVERHARSRL